MPYQKMIFLIHSHFDLKISHFDSKNRLPDVVGHEVPYILANTNPSSTKFLAFRWESSLINQVVHQFVE
jgi:hypothetical protein